MSSPSVWRDRQICRNIRRDGTGLVPERMTDEALVKRLMVQVGAITAWWDQHDLTDVPLARAVTELSRITSEMRAREHQLTLFGRPEYLQRAEPVCSQYDPE